MPWIRESLLLYTRFKGSLCLIFEKLDEIELNGTILFLFIFNLFPYLTVFSSCISLYLCVLSDNFFGFFISTSKFFFSYAFKSFVDDGRSSFV